MGSRQPHTLTRTLRAPSIGTSTAQLTRRSTSQRWVSCSRATVRDGPLSSFASQSACSMSDAPGQPLFAARCGETCSVSLHRKAEHAARGPAGDVPYALAQGDAAIVCVLCIAKADDHAHETVFFQHTSAHAIGHAPHWLHEQGHIVADLMDEPGGCTLYYRSTVCGRLVATITSHLRKSTAGYDKRCSSVLSTSSVSFAVLGGPCPGECTQKGRCAVSHTPRTYAESCDYAALCPWTCQARHARRGHL